MQRPGGFGHVSDVIWLKLVDIHVITVKISGRQRPEVARRVATSVSGPNDSGLVRQSGGIRRSGQSGGAGLNFLLKFPHLLVLSRLFCDFLLSQCLLALGLCFAASLIAGII